MKLRKRPEPRVKAPKKEKNTVRVKKGGKDAGGSVKKTRKPRTERGRKKKKASNKKATETQEVIEIPPVVHCRINDVALALENATEEELEFTAECSLIFECNHCESFFRTLESYLKHKLSFCYEKSSGQLNKDLVVVKEEIHEELQPSIIDMKVEQENSDF